VTCCSDSSVIGHSFAPTGTTDSLADKQRKPQGSAISAPVQTEAPSDSSAIIAPIQTEALSASSAATRGLETTNLAPEQEVLRPAAASMVSSCDDLFGDSVNDDMFRDEFPSQLPPDRKVLRSPVVSLAVFRIRIQIYRIHMFLGLPDVGGGCSTFFLFNRTFPCLADWQSSRQRLCIRTGTVDFRADTVKCRNWFTHRHHFVKLSVHEA
jgi:hypothetical protein